MDSTVDETRLAFEKPLRLLTLDGQPLEVRAAELLVRGGDAPVGRLTFRVEPAGYRRILDRALFNLHPRVREHAAVMGGEHEVEITAHLRPELLDDLFASPIEAEGIAEAMVETRRDGLLGALCATESWLAISVTAPLALPPDLQGTGELQTGYQTAWAQGFHAAPDATPPRDEVRAFFAAKDWPFERIGDSLVRSPIEGEHGSWNFLVRIDDELQSCTLWSVHPEEVPEQHRSSVAAFLAARNPELGCGALEIDLADGEVRLRSMILFGDAGLPATVLEHTALANLTTFDDHIELLSRVIRGELDAAAAVTQLS